VQTISHPHELSMNTRIVPSSKADNGDERFNLDYMVEVGDHNCVF
jgi:hypothetical protein